VAFVHFQGEQRKFALFWCINHELVAAKAGPTFAVRGRAVDFSLQFSAAGWSAMPFF